MVKSWKARKMVPGKDTLSIMAMHYGLSPSKARDIIISAGVKVIREDGFKGKLLVFGKRNVSAIVVGLSPRLMNQRRVTGWEDGLIGVELATTKLTRPAIRAVAQWKFLQDDAKKGSDN